MNNRRSIRKKNHDYSDPGDYFVTMCTRGREPLLGDITEDRICLSAFGVIVREEWDHMSERFPGIRLDAFTIMPNHVHGVITLVGAGLAPARTGVGPKRVESGSPKTTLFGGTTGRAGASPAPTLAGVIGAFKSLSDRRCGEAFIEEYPDHPETQIPTSG